MSVRRWQGVALFALLALLARPGRVRAAVDEYTSFDVALEEEDDEALLDHYLSRPATTWRDEWESATNALRMNQGCLTSGLWYQANDFKSRAVLGTHSRLDVSFHQTTDDESAFQYIQLGFVFSTVHLGDLGVRFRPNWDKSSQDFGFSWTHGDGTSPLQIEAVFTLRDMFNTLWEFRQTRVGNHAEPYRSHPFEPLLHVISRGVAHRYEVSGQWLTPSRKDIIDPDPLLDGNFSLWGAKVSGSGEWTAGAWKAELRGENTQVLSLHPAVAQVGDAREFRRRWSGEGALRRTLARGLEGELRYVYQDRSEDWHPPLASAAFRAYDRMPALEFDYHEQGHDRLWRVGLLYDRIQIDRTGLIPDFTYGSRKESRAFVGLQARFGKVRVQGIEGIELDSEPYPVTFHHDKGFLSLQTAF